MYLRFERTIRFALIIIFVLLSMEAGCDIVYRPDFLRRFVLYLTSREAFLCILVQVIR